MLAWLGFVSVDLGVRVYPLSPGLDSITSASAHDAAVTQCSMSQIFLAIAFLEMGLWLGVAAMLQGASCEPGDFLFDPLGYLKDKSEEEVNKIKL